MPRHVPDRDTRAAELALPLSGVVDLLWFLAWVAPDEARRARLLVALVGAIAPARPPADRALRPPLAPLLVLSDEGDVVAVLDWKNLASS